MKISRRSVINLIASIGGGISLVLFLHFYQPSPKPEKTPEQIVQEQRQQWITQHGITRVCIGDVEYFRCCGGMDRNTQILTPVYKKNGYVKICDSEEQFIINE